MYVFLGFAHNSLNCNMQLLAAFQKSFVKNPGNVLTNRKKEIKIKKRIVNALPVFKRVL
jgi:hypothetical protein